MENIYLKPSKARYEDVELPQGFFLSNSERRTAWCAARHRYAYSYGLNKRPNQFHVSSADLGTAFHVVMEELLKPYTGGAIGTLDEALLADALSKGCDYLRSTYGRTASMSSIAVLTDMVHVWSQSQYDELIGLHVVAVEKPLYMPIANPETRSGQLSETFWLTEKDGKYRIAAGNDPLSLSCAMDMWFLGRLDAILFDPETNEIWIMDHKTTSSPKGLAQKTHNDTQKDSYLALLGYGINTGQVTHPSMDAANVRIGGFIFNIVSNKPFSKPAKLKSGELSRAKSKTVHSIIFKRTAEKHGINLDAYGSHVSYLELEFDNKLMLYERVVYDATAAIRCAWEIASDAKRIAALYRAAFGDSAQADPRITHPRTPICNIAGGFCDFKSICDAGLVTPTSDDYEFTIKKSTWSMTHEE